MHLKIPQTLFKKLLDEAYEKNTDTKFLIIRILMKHYNLS